MVWIAATVRKYVSGILSSFILSTRKWMILMPWSLQKLWISFGSSSGTSDSIVFRCSLGSAENAMRDDIGYAMGWVNDIGVEHTAL